MTVTFKWLHVCYISYLIYYTTHQIYIIYVLQCQTVQGGPIKSEPHFHDPYGIANTNNKFVR